MQRINQWVLSGVCSLAVIIPNNLAYACTDFRLMAKDNSIIVTRTLEFALALDSHFKSMPREHTQITSYANGNPAISWHGKFGYVYLNALGQDMVVDGMNEVGLSFEYLYLPGETEYQTVPSGADASALPYIYLGNWVLSNFATIDEVKAALDKVYVFEYTNSALQNRVFPLHASIFDKTGKGIVIEFVNGKANVYDHIGVMTNSPQYPWQVTNLKNYVTMSPYTKDSIVVNGIAYASTGQGQGMMGLPGDASPPSRFVKMSAMTATVQPPANESEALNTAIHIINNVDIPLGYVRAKVGSDDQNELTQWTVFKNLNNGMLYYKTYGDQTIRSLSLKTVNFTPGAAQMDLPLSTTQMIVDMTSDFTKTSPAQ